MIFGTKVTLDVLSGARTAIAARNFKSSPNLSHQDYITSTLLDNFTLPCLEILLQGKSRSLYTCALNKVQELLGCPLPSNWVLDFEQAVVSALLAKRVRVGGCFFHLCQAIMRRVKNERTPLVKFRDWDNTEFRRRIKNLSSLAFLKPRDIPAAFDQLKLT